MNAPRSSDAFDRLVAIVRQGGSPHTVHSHPATRTMEEAAVNLDFTPSRIVKTIAFGLRGGETVLAALRGTRRVAYPALAALCGVSRRDLRALSPEEVLGHLGVAPGSVSPVPLVPDIRLFLDSDVLTIAPTLYCGLGRPDRTLEIAPADLLTLCSGVLGDFSRPAPEPAPEPGPCP
ncbi:YbaK/EbsC family protein [Solidesulfovibrio sp.]|uniref:YbaK/EbsC family protein n=1 Tax=Solidesulfovibrio sp. TaxID=2910990 RepID=UPI00262BD39F|nr:YbaK/EbsC family protein [Solidesulfovibrio sp.]